MLMEWWTSCEIRLTQYVSTVSIVNDPDDKSRRFYQIVINTLRSKHRSLYTSLSTNRYAASYE